MANLTGSNFTNFSSKFTNDEDAANVSLRVSYIITIIINSITCPFTVLLNVLVIMAVKRRRRLQTNSNILLACLAATDALTGLTSQPSFVAWKTSELRGMVIRSSLFALIRLLFVRVLIGSPLIRRLFVRAYSPLFSLFASRQDNLFVPSDVSYLREPHCDKIYHVLRRNSYKAKK